ncbi:MAG: C25 family cysteine peptidase [Fidelibacterota bacterium]
MRLLTTLIFLLSFTNLGGANLFRGLDPATLATRAIPLAFKPFIQENYGPQAETYRYQRGTYLIITPDILVTYLDTFVEFKRSQGFQVVVKTLSETGPTASDVKTAIQQTLNSDPLLEYVLLIGDVDGVAAMPTFYYGPENDATDQKYTHLVGNDFIPDVFIGRFSVDSITEMIVLINKTIRYHREPTSPTADWLQRALVVAGNYSNTVPIPITPKWTSYWVRDQLLQADYVSVDTVFYPPVQQGAPLIQTAINDGVGLVNYRGWGDANGWHYPEFHVGDVAGLNNGWMTPVFTSFVCNSNDFANNVDPCLGEALTRAGTPSAPKGGVAVIGPSDLHTSTKFNNVINAYMYDAMLDGGILELAPAMLAGQMGLIREFPQYNGSGQGQEFYFHVYNILGDPSLTVHTGVPAQFQLTVSTVNARDGFCEVHVTDSQGDPVASAVVAVLAGDSLLTRGMTNINGDWASTLTLSSHTSLELYVNKPGFIQGHASVPIDSSNQDIQLVGVITQGTGANGLLDFGEVVSVYPILKNASTQTVSGGTAVGTAVWGAELLTNTFDYPTLPAGGELTVSTPLVVRVLNTEIRDNLKLTLTASDSSWFHNLLLPVTKPTLTLALLDTLSINDPGPFTPTLTITNFGPAQYDSVFVTLTSLTDSLVVSQTGSANLISVAPWDDLTQTLTEYQVQLGSVAPGSDLTLRIDLWRDTVNIVSLVRYWPIIPGDSTEPMAPTWYGYWVYDNADIAYSQAPTFNWVELDPAFGGSGATEYPLDDDDHVQVPLPFAFQFFGKTYQEITISSNGWISFVPCEIDYFWNYSIPMAMGPQAMVAAFWDDLEVINEDSIRVYTRYDSDQGRFILEWSRALNGYDEVTKETFEILLYDQAALPTATGEGVIELQYLDIADVDVEKNYSTVGIEAHNNNEGLQVLFNNMYAPGAAPLRNGRSIRFTTEAPQHYVAPLDVIGATLPEVYNLAPPYPNPFNSETTIPFTLPGPETVSLSIYDLLGREVTTIQRTYASGGHYGVIWSGVDKGGRIVSSGVYFITFRAGSYYQMQKVLLLK